MKKKILLFTIFLISILFITGCTSVEDNSNNDNQTQDQLQEDILKENSSSTDFSYVKDLEGSETNQTVLLETNKGDISIELFNEKMPITAGNFENLVREGYYDGIIFHRVIDGFMIQGGDPTGTGTGGPGYAIEDEYVKDPELSNVKGTLSMANSGPNSGGSQFFINLVDNTFLDFDKEPLSSKHPVFGKVVDGMDIVEKIGITETEAGDRPVEDIVITKAIVIEE